MSSTAAPSRPHLPVPEERVAAAAWGSFLAASPRRAMSDNAAVQAAGRNRHLLPTEVRNALSDFADDSGQVGALLLRSLPVGTVPVTPATPTEPTGTRAHTEHLLLAVARTLGHPVGYVAEHGGRIVQNLLPTRAGADRQISTSSAVELEFHTETAFHPHKPHHLLLLCLRSDPSAQTLLASIHEVLPHLAPDVRRILAQPRFRTGVDESFRTLRPSASGQRTARLPGHPVQLGPPMPVLAGDPARPTLTFDADLMVGIDPEATAALATLGRVARERRIGVVLAEGDLLIVDNHTCIHGRTAFAARFDGTDRWLQRSFVVNDLAASASERTGNLITTEFG